MPKAIGRYQILDRVAVGGMAELFKATLTGDHGFEKLVAIKKILPHLANDSTFVEMFRDEARITAQLDHRHIVQVFEYGTDADTPYIAMQYVDGLDVLGLLRECARVQIRLPADLAAVIARDVLDALDYAHNAVDASGKALGIVHRDISPGNVLLSWRGDVKLTDFGIARAAERRHKTEAGTLKGKYGYMSPEQVSGVVDIDARSDLFSIGILLAEMVMARRLFTSTNDLDILLMVRDARLDRLHKYADDFPIELRVITQRALERRPEKRWQSAAEFRDAIDDWLRRTTRVGSRELASLIGRVINSPTADLDGVVDIETSEEDDGNDLSGPLTRTSMAKAEAEAARARAAFNAGDAAVEEERPSTDARSGDDLPPDPVDIPSGPREIGDLKDMPVMQLVYRLSTQRVTGMLALEGRAGVLKEVYFHDGQPQFVNSNVESERLGPYLISIGALSQQALQRALSVMHHFGGRLADTLVGLDILDPLEAYRVLAKQVASKLMETFSWQKGRYTWSPRHPNPWKARSLHLDAHRVIGAGAVQLAETLIEDWLATHAKAFIVAEEKDKHSDLGHFGIGEPLLRVYSLLDGRTRLAELAGRVRSPEARLNLLRLTYLLVQTGHARLS
ncbi:MAG: serine/threonine protein kinase [Deltaproteobacteria bacterium]|nr:serine/threonine protein kinase [Deltaproteobacteria bacterium]MCW5808193.1 serine/threonine protein kinase [Deltaproteobacteria bacterium]